MGRKNIALGLVAIGLALSLFGTLSHEWFVLDGGRGIVGGGVGLREIEACSVALGPGAVYGGTECQSLSLQDASLFRDGKTFAMAGNVASLGALLAGALAVIACALTIAGKEIRGAVAPARLAVGFYGGVVLASVVFLVSKPRELAELELGMAPFAAIVGALAAGTGALLLELEDRRRRPVPLPVARARD